MENNYSQTHKPSNPIWLSDRDVGQLLSHEEAFSAISDCFCCHAKGEFVQPLKPYVRPRGREGEYAGGRFIAMPAYLGGSVNMAGVKWIAGFPANVNRGFPRASGTLQLNCTETGRVLAIMECATLSAMRTGAVAALSVDLLAPSAKAKLTLAMIGAGPIGVTTLEAIISHSKDVLTEIRICDTKPGKAEQTANMLASYGIGIRCFTSAEEAVRGANVIVCATTGASGYLQANWLSHGWLFVALSLDDATPEVFLAADRVIVDDFEQCCREEKLLHRLVKEGRFSKNALAAELGQIVMGERTGRIQPADNVYVNPMGMAIEDIAVGVSVYKKAVANGIGQTLA
jgi:ornithine cyclodeaminase